MKSQIHYSYRQTTGKLCQRRLFQHPDLQLTEEQSQNYALLEIKKLLIQNGKSLRDFNTLPLPNMERLNQLTNSLIRDETGYNEGELRKEHEKLFAGLNSDQQVVYNAVMDSVLKKKEGLFIVYGHGGTGKTYLYKTIIASLRSKKHIVLAVASSGVSALLLLGGRTAHTRFRKPINPLENATCNINWVAPTHRTQMPV